MSIIDPRLHPTGSRLTPSHLPRSVTIGYCPPMGHFYGFKRGDAVTIISGRYQGYQGVVDSAVFQHTVDWPDEYAPGYHVA